MLDAPRSEDWRIATLGAVATSRREQMEPSANGCSRYVGLEHLDPGRFRLQRFGIEADLRSAKSRFSPGDVLYGRLRPYLDKAALAEWEGVCSTEIIVLMPNQAICDSSFLALLLHSRPFINHAIATTSGVNHPRTSWSEIGRFSFSLPSLAEQRAISALLTKIQTYIDLEDRRITILKELKTAAMAKVFREGLRGGRLKQTEIGQIPEGWDVSRLGDICPVSTGTTPSTTNSSYYCGHTAFVKTAEVANNLIERSSHSVSEEAISRYRLRVYRPGTVFLAMYGQGKTRGQVSLLAIPATTTQNTAAIESGARMRGAFLWHYLLGQYKNLRTKGNLGHLSHLNLGYVRQLLIPVPPLEDQEAIERLLSMLHERIILAERSRQAKANLFESTLHQLMTGQLRVTPLLEQGEAPTHA